MDAQGNGFAYLGSLTYKLTNGTPTLESTSHGSGRIVVRDGAEDNNPATLAGTKVYDRQYHITDHLGSVRVVFNQDGEVLARNDYYPFGKPHANPSLAAPAAPSENRFLFNSKEKQLTGGLSFLDFGARMYDNEIGRWFNPDPLAEKYISQSPYHFSGNNPLRFIDSNGMDWYEYTDDEEDENRNKSKLMWRKSQEKTYTDENGNAWKNVGESYLHVSGDRATLFTQHKNEDGELILSGNSFNLNESGERSLTPNEEFVVGLHHSESARDAAAEYILNPSRSNMWKLMGSELLAQWTNPELLVSMAAVGVAGIKSNISAHGQVRMAGRGVSMSAIDDALQNPIRIGPVKIDAKGASQKYFGRQATVVVNPETGKVITVWPTSSKFK